MADHICLLKLGDSTQAERIMDRFEQRTGLMPEPTTGGRMYALAAEEHEVDVVQTLTMIDEDWTDHLALQDPA